MMLDQPLLERASFQLNCFSQGAIVKLTALQQAPYETFLLSVL